MGSQSSVLSSLCECHGFRVDFSGGRIGFVEDVLAEDDETPPSVLLLRTGRFGRQRLAIEAEQVAAVFPREGRIVLADGPRVA